MRSTRRAGKWRPIRRITRGIWGGRRARGGWVRRFARSSSRSGCAGPTGSDVFAKKAGGLVAGFPETRAAGPLRKAQPVDFTDEEGTHGRAAEVGRLAAVVEAAG